MYGFESRTEKEKASQPSIEPYLVFGFGSSLIHQVCSKVIYDGDEIRVLGVLSYNRNADYWEITNPLAIFVGDLSSNKVDYTKFLNGICRDIDDLWWQKIRQYLGIGVFSCLAFYAGNHLYKRYKATVYNRVKRAYRYAKFIFQTRVLNRFQPQQIQNQV